MGRKKSKRKPPKSIKRIRTLRTLFECPFCNHESSCDVKFDRKKQRAQILCRICSETYETDVNCKNSFYPFFPFEYIFSCRFK